MSNLLINEPPLMVSPSLARLIGLNEAIILQQMHFWLGISKNEYYGLRWVYKTYPEWNMEFPFWSQTTIERTILRLEDAELVVSVKWFNKHPMDKTKWYTIDYSFLELLDSANMGERYPQNGAIDTHKMGRSQHTKLGVSNHREEHSPLDKQELDAMFDLICEICAVDTTTVTGSSVAKVRKSLMTVGWTSKGLTTYRDWRKKKNLGPVGSIHWLQDEMAKTDWKGTSKVTRSRKPVNLPDITPLTQDERDAALAKAAELRKGNRS